jgi:uncharacterized LabA/DUF88 family protein
MRPRAIIYVDGLNLFRRVLSGKPHLKWLDVIKLCELMIPTHEIVLVRYFTAVVKPGLRDPNNMHRQLVYLSALGTFEPRLSIHLGRMISAERVYPLSPRALDASGLAEMVKVRRNEEKGTDVALASNMVLDAALGSAELYVLLSSDSDFEPTLRILVEKLSSPVALMSPIQNPPRSLLSAHPKFVKTVRGGLVAKTQLPLTLKTKDGIIRRPREWT